MSVSINTNENDTGSPSMSKTEDNLSNSDGPLIKKSVNQNSNTSLRISSENVNGRTIVTSRRSKHYGEMTRKNYFLWMLIFTLTIIGLCNIFMSLIVIGVLRIRYGMESMEMIPEENLVKFFGRTDLDKISVHYGIYQSYGDEPMRILSEDGGIKIKVYGKSNPDTSQDSQVEILPNGINISQVRSFEVKDSRTGAIYFSTNLPKFGLLSGVDRIHVKIAQTHRITSPVNESLDISSDDQISLHGAEGIKIDSKEIIWSASNNILLKSHNGSIILDIRNGISIDTDNIPVVPMHVQNPTEEGQFKICICMPQGKVFKILIRAGANQRSVSCAHISRTPKNNPCL